MLQGSAQSALGKQNNTPGCAPQKEKTVSEPNLQQSSSVFLSMTFSVVGAVGEDSSSVMTAPQLQHSQVVIFSVFWSRQSVSIRHINTVTPGAQITISNFSHSY